MKKISAETVADSLIEKCTALGIEDTTQMKLHKLVYFAWAWYGVLYGKKLFNEEPLAWEHGPVFHSLYQFTKEFDRSPITTNDIRRGSDDLDEESLSFLDGIVAHYGKKSAFELRDISHNKIWKEAHKGKTQKLSFEKVTNFHREHLKEAVAEKYDEKEEVWTASSEIIPGLVLESGNYQELLKDIQEMGLEMINLNCS